MENNTNTENELITCENKLDYFEHHCITIKALKIITGKWKVSILKTIAGECPKRFGILKKDLDNIAQGTLTTVLRELEQDGLVQRKVFAEVPPRVEYALTEKGMKLLPILNELAKWYEND